MALTVDNLTAEKTLPKTVKNVEPPLSVCFVCTGNTCRSPMAEAVLKHLGGKDFTVCSAGLSAVNGDPITKNAADALMRAGIQSTPENDYLSHRAKMIDEDTVRFSDRVIAMTSQHMMTLLWLFPEYAEKFSVMQDEIPDPFMYGAEVYDRCLEKITDCIRREFIL